MERESSAYALAAMQTMQLWKSWTTARESHLKFKPESLSRFLRQNPSARAMVSGWIPHTALSRTTTAISASNPVWVKLLFRYDFHLVSRETRKHETVSTYGSDSRCTAAHTGLRGVPEDGRHVGSLAALSHLRPRRLLRFIEEQACDQTFPCDQTSHHAIF